MIKAIYSEIKNGNGLLAFKPCLFWIKEERINAFDWGYLITENDEGKFYIYGIKSARYAEKPDVLSDSDIDDICELVPNGQHFVDIVLDWEVVQQDKDIELWLGDDWVFALCVSSTNDSYTIERNPDLSSTVNIGALVDTASKAWRMAQGY